MLYGPADVTLMNGDITSVVMHDSFEPRYDAQYLPKTGFDLPTILWALVIATGILYPSIGWLLQTNDCRNLPWLLVQLV